MTKRTEIYIDPQEITEQNNILLNIKQNFSDIFFQKNNYRPKYNLITYGCAMNERDSQTIDGMLQMAGFESCKDSQEADLVLFNTCCVRDHAELKVFGNVGALAKLKEEKPDLLIGVCGCMMQQEDVAKSLFKKFKFVNLVFGTHSLHLLPTHLQSAINKSRVFSYIDSTGIIAENQPISRKKKYTASVNIMYGCNNFCSYCIVPYVRGRERSRNSDDIISEIQELILDGAIEITLLGQNVNSYNNDSQENLNFAELLDKIQNQTSIKRIRFMTSHPKDISQELLNTISNSKNRISTHIHLPVQSGSNRILEIMRRNYTREHYFDILEKARNIIKDVQISSDIIVGFPGETQEDFEQTLELVRKAEFSALFVYLYSPRKNTDAEKMPDQISLETKKQRLYQINNLQEEINSTRNNNLVGQTFEILVEGTNSKNPELLIGRTLNSRAINFIGKQELLGTFVNIKVTKINKTAIFGELI